jgi:VIT1/CCC1 family predicted Fe2+/Mn2+ transporter
LESLADEASIPAEGRVLLGGLAARAGGAGVAMGAIRVTFWGALAMVLTAGVGALFGTVA